MPKLLVLTVLLTILRASYVTPVAGDVIITKSDREYEGRVVYDESAKTYTLFRNGGSIVFPAELIKQIKKDAPTSQPAPTTSPVTTPSATPVSHISALEDKKTRLQAAIEELESQLARKSEAVKQAQDTAKHGRRTTTVFNGQVVAGRDVSSSITEGARREAARLQRELQAIEARRNAVERELSRLSVDLDAARAALGNGDGQAKGGQETDSLQNQGMIDEIKRRRQKRVEDINAELDKLRNRLRQLPSNSPQRGEILEAIKEGTREQETLESLSMASLAKRFEKADEAEAQQRQEKSAIAKKLQTHFGRSQKASADLVCQQLLQRGVIETATFEGYSALGGFDLGPTPPAGEIVMVRYTFVFTTQAGFVRKYLGFVAVRRRGLLWLPDQMSVDGNEIGAWALVKHLMEE